MKYQLTLIILFTNLLCSAQQGKTVIIDKLISKMDTSRLRNMLVTLDNKFIVESEDISVYFDPNISDRIVISNIEIDSFRLLLDDKGGYCKIYAPKTDTIKIKKWKVYKNGLTDISVGKMRYSNFNDEIEKNINEEHKNSGIKKLNQISVVFNNRKIKSSVSIIGDTTLRHVHGKSATQENVLANFKPTPQYYSGELKDISRIFFTKIAL